MERGEGGQILLPAVSSVEEENNQDCESVTGPHHNMGVHNVEIFIEGEAC